MKDKYIILDEINLELLTLDEAVGLFNSKEEAIDNAKHQGIDGWQVIAIPFGDC